MGGLRLWGGWSSAFGWDLGFWWLAVWRWGFLCLKLRLGLGRPWDVVCVNAFCLEHSMDWCDVLACL